MKAVFRFFTFFLFLLCPFSLFSQEQLSNLNTSWTNVLPGVVISEPAVTSYGFCAVTDARTLSAFSNSGVLLWEKSISKSKKVIVSCLPGDFICFIDTSSSIMKVLNPSGTEIWSKKLSFSVTNPPVCGRDGRFFIKGENKLECYGLNGVCKWSMETPAQKNMQLTELSDGSLIVFLSDLKGKTQGLRISPYGVILEEILFSGEVKQSFSSDCGILLIFADGTAGLFDVENNLSKNKWVVPEKSQKYTYVVSSSGTDFLLLELLSDGIVVNQIHKNNGKIIHSFKIDGIEGNKIIKSYYSDNGLFLCDSKTAVIYNMNGNELWTAKVPYEKGKTLWNYLVYTNNNYLVFCYKNWTINAYHIIQNKFNAETELNKNQKVYESFLSISDNQFSVLYQTSFEKYLTDESRISDLNQGYYGEKESAYESDVLSICQMYSTSLSTSDFGTRKQLSVFDQDSTAFEKILTQLVLFGNEETQNCAASILSKTTNHSYINILLNGIKENGYDPDGNILKALELKAGKTDRKDNTIIFNICDAVYSVCVFMGRPAYNSKGKDILKNFLYPAYDAKVREYARNTLKKIIELDL